MAAFGMGTHKIIIRHPTSPRNWERGEKPKGTQGVHTLYRLEFFAFSFLFIFSCVFYFPVIFHCHIEEPSRTAKALKSYLSFSGIRPLQATSNNKHRMLFIIRKKMTLTTHWISHKSTSLSIFFFCHIICDHARLDLCSLAIGYLGCLSGGHNNPAAEGRHLRSA